MISEINVVPQINVVFTVKVTGSPLKSLDCVGKKRRALMFILHYKIIIKQLIHNLISNSLKFRGLKSPIIKIGCKEKEEGDGWIFYIEDNGIGIEQQYYDKIFGIFKRLYSRDDYPGTGIGLALCKRIVEAHDGIIWINPEVNEGTKICFTIIKSVIMLT